MHKVQTTTGQEVEVLDKSDLDAAKSWALKTIAKYSGRFLIGLITLVAAAVMGWSTLNAKVNDAARTATEVKNEGTLPGLKLKEQVDSIRQEGRRNGEDLRQARADIAQIREMVIRLLQEQSNVRPSSQSLSKFPAGKVTP